MSINSLTNDDIRRRNTIVSWGRVPETSFNDSVQLYALNQPLSEEAQKMIPTAKAEKAVQDNDVTNALNSLIKYIPTETVTLYVAAISATPALSQISSHISYLSVFWICAIITPIVTALVYIGKLRNASLPLPSKVTDYPLWSMSAGFVAFLVWALAVPNNPYIHGDVQGVVAGFLAVVCSTMLSLVEPLFGQR